MLEFISGRVQVLHGFPRQVLRRITEHFAERLIAGHDDALPRHEQADRRHLERKAQIGERVACRGRLRFGWQVAYLSWRLLAFFQGGLGFACSYGSADGGRRTAGAPLKLGGLFNAVRRCPSIRVLQDAYDARRRHVGPARDASNARPAWRRGLHFRNDRRGDGVGDRPRRTGSLRVGQAVYTAFNEPCAPLGHRMRRDLVSFRHDLVIEAVRTAEHDACAKGQRRLRVVLPLHRLQRRSLFVTQNQADLGASSLHVRTLASISRHTLRPTARIM
ncbi:hypothetical protein BURMUCF2_0649 [Burkholderia multivorans CF2]|nr:hypothetical protein BURMUCF2_0649 [Burkholderia multivorans CF2]